MSGYSLCPLISLCLGPCLCEYVVLNCCIWESLSSCHNINRLCVRLIYLIITLLKLLSLHIFYFPAYFVAWCYCALLLLYIYIYIFLFEHFPCQAVSIVRFLCSCIFFCSPTFDMKRNFVLKMLEIYIPFQFFFCCCCIYFVVAFIQSRYKWQNRDIYTEIITLGWGMKWNAKVKIRWEIFKYPA